MNEYNATINGNISEKMFSIVFYNELGDITKTVSFDSYEDTLRYVARSCWGCNFHEGKASTLPTFYKYGKKWNFYSYSE